MLGFSSTEDRFFRDLPFRRKMLAQGWQDHSIHIIDDIAVTALHDPGRTSHRICATAGHYYRNINMARPEDPLHRAHTWDHERDSVHDHWSEHQRRWREWAQRRDEREREWNAAPTQSCRWTSSWGAWSDR